MENKKCINVPFTRAIRVRCTALMAGIKDIIIGRVPQSDPVVSGLHGGNIVFYGGMSRNIRFR